MFSAEPPENPTTRGVGTVEVTGEARKRVKKLV